MNKNTYAALDTVIKLALLAALIYALIWGYKNKQLLIDLNSDWCAMCTNKTGAVCITKDSYDRINKIQPVYEYDYPGLC